MFPIALYCAYQCFCVRRNKFSGQKEFKVLNKPFEVHVLGPLITRRLKNSFASVIYKQETEETQVVMSAFDKLVKTNSIAKLLTDGDFQVKVLHDELAVGLFMNLDRTLYITVAALKMAQMDESKVALLVSHELAHFLMDH